MAIFNAAPEPQSPNSSLRLPAQKRISTPASQRLSTITEGLKPATSQQPKGILRNSSSEARTPRRPGTPRQQSGGPPNRRSQDTANSRTHDRGSQDTTKTGPPAYEYEWVPEPIDEDEDLCAPVEGEKLAQLRAGGPRRRRRDRGGWGRLALVVALTLLVVIGLAVGLGVGMTRRKQSKGGSNADSGQSSQPAGTTPDTGQAQQFPLGEYSMITALRTVNTSCTSNPATWRCYPYSVYDPSDSVMNSSSLATFNWIIANTSSTYATNTTGATSGEGVPSNLTISATDNPFSISFTNQSLTYINTASNASSARYTFNFQMAKSVIPSSSITSNNAAAECFFNSTTFTGTLYLEAGRTYPSADLADSTGVGGYTPWPYAIEILQASRGGEDVPACYEMVNGNVGDRILTFNSTEPESSQCLCDYRNY